MYKQIRLYELVAAIQDTVNKNTQIPCYDHVKKNTPSPFYFVEVINKRPSHSKTMWRDTFTVWIHAIAEPNDSSLPVYQLIQKLEEALTEDIVLPEPYQLVLQTNNGIQTINTDETNEKHAILEFGFMVCYGLKCK